MSMPARLSEQDVCCWTCCDDAVPDGRLWLMWVVIVIT